MGAYYLLSDLRYRSVALTDSAGAVVEAYDTDAYGNTLLFKAAGARDIATHKDLANRDRVVAGAKSF